MFDCVSLSLVEVVICFQRDNSEHDQCLEEVGEEGGGGLCHDKQSEVERLSVGMTNRRKYTIEASSDKQRNC